MLANFKNAARAANIANGQAWTVLAHKHWDAACSIMSQPGLPISEPPEQRFADAINYLLLGWALHVEGRETP